MSVLPIYTYGTSVLRKKAKPVTAVTDEIVKLVMDMFETMHAANGIGLAATQVGSLHRVIVVDISDVEETKGVKPFTLINPELVSEEGAWVVEEGCLSIPNVRDEVERAETLRVRFKDANFKDVELEAGGLEVHTASSAPKNAPLAMTSRGLSRARRATAMALTEIATSRVRERPIPEWTATPRFRVEGDAESVSPLASAVTSGGTAGRLNRGT